ncbi:MAG: hypothetical protein AAGI07_12935, partial [Bacteroidota bacterium]
MIMNTKQVTRLLLLLIGISWGTNSIAQDQPGDYATIFIYRPKSTLTGIMRQTVKINGAEIGWLRNGSRMRYTIYTTGMTKIDLDNYMYILGTPQRERGADIKTLIDVKPGETYFMRIQLNIDGAGPGYSFVSKSLGESEYLDHKLFKLSYPEIIRVEDISALYAQQSEESIHEYKQERDFTIGNAKEKITKYVQQKMDTWQERGRYEKSAEYTQRVNEETREFKVQEFTDEAIQKFAMESLVTEGALIDYDPDNETFRIKMDGFAPFYLNVLSDEAPSFDTNFQQVDFQEEVFTLVNDNTFAFLSVEVFNPVNNKLYVYNNEESIAFNPAGLDLKYEPIE